jgi:hypothetical protein
MIIIASTQVPRAQLELATTVQPERVTELYFTDPGHLPRAVTPGGHAEVTFEIRNDEAGPQSYTYLVTLESFVDLEDSALVKIGSVNLTDGERRAVNVGFDVPIPNTRALLTVRLEGAPQTLHLWLTSS